VRVAVSAVDPLFRGSISSKANAFKAILMDRNRPPGCPIGHKGDFYNVVGPLNVPRDR
jgi:hypothetical protein